MAAPAPSDDEIAPAEHPGIRRPGTRRHSSADGHDPSSDLSSEWEHSLFCRRARCGRAELSDTVVNESDTDADASSNPEIAETVEEVRFYLDHFMTDQARAGIEKLETLTSDARILDPLRAAIESSAQPPAEPESEITEINADEINATRSMPTSLPISKLKWKPSTGPRSPPRPV